MIKLPCNTTSHFGQFFVSEKIKFCGEDFRKYSKNHGNLILIYGYSLKYEQIVILITL